MVESSHVIACGRLLLIFFQAAVSCLSSAQELQSMDSLDPAEAYFRSYTEAGKAEELEKSGDFQGAAGKIAEAVLLIDRIRKDHPDWKPEMIARRVESNGEIVDRLRPKAEAILAGIAQELPEVVEEEPEIISLPPRTPKKDVLRRTPGNWEDPNLNNEYFEKRGLFDALLRMKTKQDQVTLLCSQFAKAVGRMDAARENASPLLGKSMSYESQRLPRVSNGYLRSPVSFARVRLSRDWMRADSYEKAVQDFRSVFGQNLQELAFERPDLTPGFGEGVNFFQMPYLCQVDDFTRQFKGLKGFRSRNTRTSIGVPGFPKMSFYYYAYDGDFTAWGGPGGIFNRMLVITDSWDQVVGVQFTCEAPKEVINGDDAGIGVYNFVQFRRKGTPSYRVIHETAGTPGGGLKIVTMLKSGENKPKEINVLHLPQPTVMLLSYCLSPKAVR
jgi:hypothetical protein